MITILVVVVGLMFPVVAVTTTWGLVAGTVFAVIPIVLHLLSRNSKSWVLLSLWTFWIVASIVFMAIVFQWWALATFITWLIYLLFEGWITQDFLNDFFGSN